MNEASKTLKYYPELKKYFTGDGLDIGAGNDPLTQNTFDKKDGDANNISQYVFRKFGHVVSFHCLEHMHNPKNSLLQWWDLVESGGYLILAVPDFKLYEHSTFPSKYNQDHKHTFSMDRSADICFPDLISTLPNSEIIRCEIQANGYNFDIKNTDQTKGNALAQLLTVVRKTNPTSLDCNSYIFRTHKHIGDELICTAIIRDVKLAFPNFKIDFKSNYSEIWSNNPYLTKGIQGREIKLVYAGDEKLASSGSCIQGFLKSAELNLNVQIPLTRRKVDVHFSKSLPREKPYWIINAGFQSSVPTKGYPHYQDVVNLLPEIEFIQVGSSKDCHKPLKNVINLLDKTNMQEYFNLVWNAQGILTPISGIVHLSTINNIPTVVVAGGRETVALAGYDNTHFISAVGKYPCSEIPCMHRTKCPYKINGFSKCMSEISPDEIASLIRHYAKYF